MIEYLQADIARLKEELELEKIAARAYDEARKTIESLQAENEALRGERKEFEKLSDDVLYNIPTIRGVRARYITVDDGKEWLEFPDGSGCGIYEWAFYDKEARRFIEQIDQLQADCRTMAQAMKYAHPEGYSHELGGKVRCACEACTTARVVSQFEI